jgi:hypothetical protein
MDELQLERVVIIVVCCLFQPFSSYFIDLKVLFCICNDTLTMLDKYTSYFIDLKVLFYICNDTLTMLDKYIDRCMNC